MTFSTSTKRGFKAQEPKLCPTCWNAMKEIHKGVWNCAKHGDPSVWENRHRRRSVVVVPEVASSDGLPENLRQHIAPATRRYKLTDPIRDYLLACVDRGETAGKVADRIWRDMGYKNADAAKGSFYRALRLR